MTMRRVLQLSPAACLIAALGAVEGRAQTTVIDPPVPASEIWVQPYAPFRVVGDLYYVGTYDLGVFLITTPQGHVLINTGVAGSVDQIRSNVESLGFALRDVRILLTTQAHWDHVADLAEIKRITGAQLYAHVDEVALLEDGGNSDYLFGGKGSTFEPVKVDRSLRDGDAVSLGSLRLTLHHHPGHTRGASSFTFTTRDETRSYDVAILNMPSINAGTRLVDNPIYPRIAEDYTRTFAALKAVSSDVVWVAAHASQFGLHRKRQPTDGYDPARFIDPEDLVRRVGNFERAFLDQVERERTEAR
jgi:metallo-beta-lactamase class B